MIRVSPRRSRPLRLITALRIVSAIIGASSCRSSPRNLISHCPLVSGNWASGFISTVSVLVEAGGRSNARSVLCLASELHPQQTMTSVDRHERGQWTPDTLHLWPCNPPPPPPPTSYSSRGVSFANLIPVSVQASTATSSPPQTLVLSVFRGRRVSYLRQELVHISVVCLYRPPPSRKNKLSNQLFLQEFSEFLTQSAGSHSNLVLLGDFNFHYDDCADTQVNRLKTMLSGHGLTQLVDVPHIDAATHWTGL